MYNFDIDFFRDIYLLLPALCFAIFFILNGLWVFFETDAGKYVVIEGRCTGIEKTPLRKRIKNIHIETDDITVKVIVKQRMKQLDIGDNIRVYVFEKTPVYDQEQCKLLCSYLALEKTRRKVKMVTAEDLLLILEEIKKLVLTNSDSDGNTDFDSQKVRIALELAKTELIQSLN